MLWIPRAEILKHVCALENGNIQQKPSDFPQVHCELHILPIPLSAHHLPGDDCRRACSRTSTGIAVGIAPATPSDPPTPATHELVTPHSRGRLWATTFPHEPLRRPVNKTARTKNGDPVKEDDEAITVPRNFKLLRWRWWSVFVFLGKTASLHIEGRRCVRVGRRRGVLLRNVHIGIGVLLGLCHRDKHRAVNDVNDGQVFDNSPDRKKRPSRSHWRAKGHGLSLCPTLRVVSKESRPLWSTFTDDAG